MKKENISPLRKTVNSGKKNRTKGHNYERNITKAFINLGFTKTKSSRAASKLYDDSGIDHWGIQLPDGRLILTQCKSGYKNSRPKADVEFKNQQNKIKQSFHEKSLEASDNNIQILFHKIDDYSPEHHLVTLKYNDFMEIFTEFVKNKTNV